MVYKCDRDIVRTDTYTASANPETTAHISNGQTQIKTYVTYHANGRLPSTADRGVNSSSFWRINHEPNHQERAKRGVPPPILDLHLHLHQEAATVVYSQAIWATVRIDLTSGGRSLTNRLLSPFPLPRGIFVVPRNFVCASRCTVGCSGTNQTCQPLFGGMLLEHQSTNPRRLTRRQLSLLQLESVH